MNFFSCEYNPGATNAHTWYIECGKETMKAAIIATFIGTKNGVVTAVAIICPPTGSLLNNGAASSAYILLANGKNAMNTTIKPATMRNNRLRNSIKWEMKFSVGVTRFI